MKISLQGQNALTERQALSMMEALEYGINHIADKSLPKNYHNQGAVQALDKLIHAYHWTPKC